MSGALLVPVLDRCKSASTNTQAGLGLAPAGLRLCDVFELRLRGESVELVDGVGGERSSGPAARPIGPADIGQLRPSHLEDVTPAII